MATIAADATSGGLPAEVGNQQVPTNQQQNAAQGNTNQLAPQNNTLSELESIEAPPSAPMHPIVAGFNRLGILRQAGLIIGLAASVAIAFAVFWWTQEETYKPLINDFGRYDAAEVMEILDQASIVYHVDPNSGMLMVKSDQFAQARLKLAAQGITETQAIGYELLDKEQALGTSQFMETTKYRRSLEGELARTITSMNQVKSARVHLAIPKRSVFVRDTRKPTASVFLELYAGRALKPEQSMSIVNLVASSIPEMKPEDVTVVDQKGRLLSMEDDSSDLAIASKQFDYTRKLEDTLSRRIYSILEPIVGGENFKAEVSADVDFTTREQTEEQFNPDLPALRSEQVLDEKKIGGMEGGIPGALSNQPPGEVSVPEVAGAGEDGQPQPPTNTRKQATRNFELDRVISYTNHELGKVRRLSVAVAVNDLILPDEETGDLKRVAWSQEEIDRLTILIKDTVGFQAARGDSVTVINSPFLPDDEAMLEEQPFWTQPWFWDIAKQMLAILFVLAIVFGVVRPAIKSLTSTDEEGSVDDELDADLAALEASSSDLSDDLVSLTGGESLLPGPSEGFERQLNALKALIAEDPQRVAQAMKDWINDNE
ncbi:flagellar basal-body MS-ring/collar protein FliF [Litoribacillus peritrichatus]|uniref:Flagellar M-ring protein n=1 Tax=Litoribacillus peritrichatus TaxID=718191 RepID=A0ABP7M8B8_9GAMM